MGKIRIYELAKELGVDNRAVVLRAKELGMKGKESHSNSLESDEADMIRRAFIRLAIGAAPASEVKERREVDASTGATITVRRKGDIIRRRRSSDEEEGGQSADAAAGSVVANERGHTETSIASENGMSQSAPPTLDSIFKSKDELAREASVESVPEESAEELEFKEESSVAEVTVEALAAEEVASEEEPSTAPSEHTVSVEQRSQAVSDGAQVEKKGGVGPKILGKITLPTKKVVKAKVKVAEPAPGVVAVPETEEDDDGKKRRSEAREKRSRKREITRVNLVDYEGGVPRRAGKKRRDKETDAHEEVSILSEKAAPKTQKRVVRIDEVITVGDLARALSLKAGEVIAKLIDLGVMATINQTIDVDTATIVAEEFGHSVESVAYDETAAIESEDGIPEDLIARAPVVTVMGHVDHGKTSLLDKIRKSSVAAKEHGGITQHIGAYTVKLESGNAITFIDTPGHAAFTEMRARGAQVTDIVILVVAADDGVMPQTIEAINHAKAAKVPIVVALNKIDKPGTNPDRIKQALAEQGLQPEEWGGDTMFFPVSALRGDGVEKLLEGVLLQAEVKELRANPKVRAAGTIIESKQERGRGVVATVLVQKGTLRVGESFVAGAEFGRVRSMMNDVGEAVETAAPSMPVEITGFSGPPSAGDDFYVVDSDAKAREVAFVRAERRKKKELLAAAGGPMTLEEFAKRAKQSEAPELNVIMKADAQGSVEAIAGAVNALSRESVRVKIVHNGVGAITESDVKLAIASRAILVGFGVRAEPRAAEDAEASGIEIRYYNVIYDLIDDIKKAMAGLLAPIRKESSLGRVEVRNTFTIPKIGVIAGCYVTDGMVKRGSNVRLLRDNVVVYQGKMSSLRRFKDDVKEVQTGFECGIGLEQYSDLKVGDVLEVFEVKEIAQTLD